MALKDDRVQQCLRSGGSEFQMWAPKQEKEKSISLAFVLLDFSLPAFKSSLMGVGERTVYYVRVCVGGGGGGGGR